MSTFCSFEATVYEDWAASVDEKSDYNLAQPLVKRNEQTNLLAINFDPQVKYKKNNESHL